MMQGASYDLNKQPKQQTLASELERVLKMKTALADSNLPVTALWSPATSVVVTSHPSFSVFPQPWEQLHISCVITGNTQLYFIATFPLEIYWPLQELIPCTTLIYHPDFGSFIALQFLLLLQAPNLTFISPIAKQNGEWLSHFERHK